MLTNSDIVCQHCCIDSLLNSEASREISYVRDPELFKESLLEVSGLHF